MAPVTRSAPEEESEENTVPIPLRKQLAQSIEDLGGITRLGDYFTFGRDIARHHPNLYGQTAKQPERR